MEELSIVFGNIQVCKIILLFTLANFSLNFLINFPKLQIFLSYFRTFWAKNNGTSIKLARGNSFFGICTQVLEDRTWSFAWTFFLQKKYLNGWHSFKKSSQRNESLFSKKNVHKIFLHFWKIGNVVIILIAYLSGN